MEEILNYVVKKIEDAELKEVEGKPMWYLAIENIFPDDYYQEILKYTPKDLKMYHPLSEQYTDRFKYELAYGENCNESLATLNEMSGDMYDFWKDFQATFVEKDDLLNSFLQKYKEYIPKFDANIGINCRLSKDLKGYSIGVHTDRRNKIISALFYTPNRTDKAISKEWGTQVLTPKSDYFPHTTEKHHAYNKDGSHNDFDLYDWVECKPNSMFSWVVTQQSYHGVPPIAIDGIRDTIAFFGKAKNNWQRRKLYGEDIIFYERK